MMKITIKRIIKAALPFGAIVMYRTLRPVIKRLRDQRLKEKTVNTKVATLVKDAKGIEEKTDPKVIVSITSYGYRIKETAPITIASLLRQTTMPDKVILWLAHGEKVPSILTGLVRYGLEIKYYEDIKSYKKLIPALEEFPNSVIITADDDVEYPKDWLNKFLVVHRKNPDQILAQRGRRISVTTEGVPAPYEDWPFLDKKDVNSHLILPNGIGGVLYPPHSLSKKVFNKDLFMELSPTGDDLWFWAMAELKGTKRMLVQNGYQNISEYELDTQGLWNTVNHDTTSGNDAQFINILKKFPKLIKNIGATRATNDGFAGSEKYWESRYAGGDNSGSGSYDNLARFKSKILNKFVKQNGINAVIEFGSGDGNQLLTAKYPHYVGFDVSQTATDICRRLFKNDRSKEFYTLDKFKNQKAELTLSLDVLYHLVEEDVFIEHINNLFKASTKYVIVYAYDGDDIATADHVKSRKFTEYINQNFKGWELIQHIPNDYPYDESNPSHTTWADFYIYEKKK
jgi:protein O-GlcNAc transferase